MLRAEHSEGKATALGKFVARTVRSKVNFAERLTEMAQRARDEYQQLLDESQGALPIYPIRHRSV